MLFSPRVLFRRAALQVQSLREVLHPALLPGEPLPQGARGGPPVRVQAAEIQGTCGAKIGTINVV